MFSARTNSCDGSIVAVHGLDTSSPKTWVAYERDGPPDVRGHAFNWLSDDDMLPAVVPKARIWTFDYNANYHTNASLVDLLALGEMLLRSLSTVRTNVRAPISFRMYNHLNAEAINRNNHSQDPYYSLARALGGL